MAKERGTRGTWRGAWILWLALGGTVPATAVAYTANKVWFEFRPEGGFRVHVNYTIPELKERREAYVEFRQRRDAERYYWDLVRGAEFFPPNAARRRFVTQPLNPEPW